MCVLLGQCRATGLCLWMALGCASQSCSPQASSQPYVGLKSILSRVLVFFRGKSRGQCNEGPEVHFSRSSDVGRGEPEAQGMLYSPSPQPWPERLKLKCAGNDL